MISLTKLIDPLSGYIAKVQKDVSDRDRQRQQSIPKISGAAKLLSAEQATKAAVVNRLTAEINEIKSGLSNMRQGLQTVDTAEAAYSDVLSILEDMQSKVSVAQTAEDLNTSVTTDATALTTAFNQFSQQISAVITSRQMNSENLIDGTFVNKVYPLWSGEASSPTISLDNIKDTMASFRTFSALALAGGLNQTGTNIVANKTISITGSGGTNSFDQITGESASSLAARINILEKTDDTSIGVLANARSSARLNDLTNAGTIGISLASEKLGMGSVSISDVVIADKTNLSALAAAINRRFDTTGIFAKMGATSNDIILIDPSGGNIGVSGFTHSVNNSTLSVSVDRRDGVTDFVLDDAVADANYGNVVAGFSDGGSIEFGMVGNLTSENVNLASHNVGSTTLGEVSIDANKNVFIGTGSSTLQVGSVDGTNDGVGGNSLKINFSSNSRVFATSDFSSDSNWTKNTNQIISGTTQLGGLNTLIDNTFPSANAQGASGTLSIDAGTEGDTISAVNINGVNVLGNSVNFTTDNDTTATLIRNAINSNSSSPNYTATVSGAVVTITAASNTGTTPNSYNISAVGTGDFASTGTTLGGGVDNDKASITGGSPFSTTISGGKANLTTTNATTEFGYTAVKGPAIISNSSVLLISGEQISFDYTANGLNSDKADVQAYLVNADTNAFESMLNTTVSSSGSVSVSHTVGNSGNYKFAFVSGAFDNDGDRDSSSNVTVDNISVTAIPSSVLDTIKNNVTYENLNFSASNSSYTPQISITSVTSGGASTTETADVPATLAGFSLTGGAEQEVFATGEVTVLSKNSFSLSQQSQQSNGTSFWETADASIETLELFTGGSPLGANETLRIQNASERVSLAINKVSEYKDSYVSPLRNRFDFGEFDTSNYLESLNTTKAEMLDVPQSINLSQRTAKMIIADEIQNLLAKAGNASADDVYALIKST